MLDYGVIGSLEDIGNKASQITGGNGFITKLQRQALGSVGDGINVANVFDGITNSLDQVVDLTASQRKQISKNIRNVIPENATFDSSVNALDVFDSVQKLEDIGHQYLNTSTYLTGNIRNEQIGRIYLDAAANLKDSLEAGARGSKAISSVVTPQILNQAYQISPKLAEDLSKARTIKDLRAIQAPFVRIQKMIDLTQQSELSAFQNLSGELKGMSKAIPTLQNPLAPIGAFLDNPKVSTNLASILQKGGMNAKGAVQNSLNKVIPSPRQLAVAAMAGRQGQIQPIEGLGDVLAPEQAMPQAKPQAMEQPVLQATPQQGKITPELLMIARLQLSDANYKKIKDVYDLQQGVTGGGKQLPAGELGKLADTQLAIGLVPELNKAFDEAAGAFGPITGRIRGAIPYDTQAQKAQSVIFLVKQIIGKGLEGGVLRKEDEYKYEKILPRISDTPETVKNKIDLLNRVLTSKYNTTVQTFQTGGYNPFGGSGTNPLDVLQSAGLNLGQ